MLSNISRTMKEIMKPSKLFCVVAIMFIAVMFPTSAADFEVDGICYNVINENEVEVTSPDSVKYAGEVLIPSTVVNAGTTYHVTRIGNKAFYSCKELTLVDIPEGITSIGDNAFAYSSKLENVELPNSLVSIERYGFYGCSSFTTFHVPRNLAQFGDRALIGCSRIRFFSCSSLSQHFKAVDGVLYSKDMTELYYYPIADPRTTFDVPAPVARIHEYCFYGNQTLTQVNFPETLRWIDMNIFRDCQGIETAYIPDGVTHMGVTVFGGCSNLTSVHLPASLDSLSNSTFMLCDKLTEVVIPRNVKYIGTYAFYQAGVRTVTFEEGSCLETIDHDAFHECHTLQYVDMPNSVKTIEYQAFYRCDSLKWAHVSDSLTSMGTCVFAYSPLLTECEIPGGVTTIWNAIAKCDGLKRLKIGSKNSAPGVTLIKNCGIVDCEQIEYLELGANVDSLESHALVDLKNLKVLISWAPIPPRCDGYWHSFDPYPQQMSVVLYVPKASLETYQTAVEWENFKTIVAIEDVGDVNGDGTVSIGDVTALIDILLGGDLDRVPYCDVNLDGSVTIADVTALIDILLGGI